MLPAVSNLFKRAYAPYRAHPKLTTQFIALFFLPVFFIGITKFSVDLIGLVYGIVTTGALLLLVGGVVMSLVSLWFSIAYIQALADIDNGTAPNTVGTYLKRSRGMILPIFGLTFLVGLIVLGGFVLLIIPGIIFSIWFVFTVQARVLDQKKGVSALGFSRLLVKNNWWGVFGRIVLGMLTIFAIMSIYQGIVNSLSSFDLTTLTFQKLTIFSFIITLITSALQALITPFASGIPTILYLDLKKSATTPVDPLSPPQE